MKSCTLFKWAPWGVSVTTGNGHCCAPGLKRKGPTLHVNHFLSPYYPPWNWKQFSRRQVSWADYVVSSAAWFSRWEMSGGWRKGKELELQILPLHCSISFWPFLCDTSMSDFPTLGSYLILMKWLITVWGTTQVLIEGLLAGEPPGIRTSRKSAITSSYSWTHSSDLASMHFDGEIQKDHRAKGIYSQFTFP